MDLKRRLVLIFEFFVEPEKANSRQLINRENYRGKNEPVNVEFGEKEKKKKSNSQNRENYGKHQEERTEKFMQI